MNYNKTRHEQMKPYKALNMLVKNMEVQDPLANHQHETQQPTTDTGYINIGVYTASGALPVKDAVVTVYHTYDDSEEHIVYHLITDESGRVPTLELPVEYEGPGQQTEFYYSTYNLRAQADGYYTVNILDIQIYPHISTDYRINLIPTAQGGPSQAPEQTIIIPPKNNG